MTSTLERRVVEEIERRRSELADLLAVLVGFDTRDAALPRSVPAGVEGCGPH